MNLFLFLFFNCHRITNAVKNSGVLRERLFRAAYNSKRQALMSGMYASDQSIAIALWFICTVRCLTYPILFFVAIHNAEVFL